MGKKRVTWGDLEVGSKIMHDGGKYRVIVIKPGGIETRFVLEPIGGTDGAKIATRVRPEKKVKLAKKSAAPDRPGTAIDSSLEAEEVAVLHLDKHGNVTVGPVDITTVASHLRLLHGVELQGLSFESEADLLRVHDELHEAPYHEPAVKHLHKEKK